MSNAFLAARLRRSASFQRLTGVSIATFYAMLTRLQGPWDNVQALKVIRGRPWGTGALEDHLLIRPLCNCSPWGRSTPRLTATGATPA